VTQRAYLRRINAPVQVKYDKFWVDGAQSLHEEAPEEGFTGQGALGILSSGPLGMLGGLASSVLPASVRLPLSPALAAVGSAVAPALSLGASATEHLIEQAAHVLFPAFSSFPILYVSDEMAIFQFNAARSPIAVRKVADTTVSPPPSEGIVPKKKAPKRAYAVAETDDDDAAPPVVVVAAARAQPAGAEGWPMKKAAAAEPPAAAAVAAVQVEPSTACLSPHERIWRVSSTWVDAVHSTALSASPRPLCRRRARR
jgi:hypothetical protein